MKLLKLTEKLINFQTVTGNIKEINDCADFCINYFGNNPKIFVKKVIIDNLPSVLLSNANTLDLDVFDIGHIDVVPVSDDKMFNPRIENGVMCARGAADMKSVVACGMQALEYVVQNNINIKYGILIVSDEETNSAHARHWAKNIGLKAKIVLDGDGGGMLKNIVQKSKGFCFAKMVFKGKSAHGSKPWEGVDAVENAINTVVNLRELIPYISENTKLNDKWVETMHVGTINGGTALNAIASLAEVSIDIRFTEKYTVEKMEEIVKNSLVGDVEITSCICRKPILNKSDDKYLQLYKKIGEDITGDSMELSFETSGTDARYFNDGKTTIITNQANCGEFHADGEWIDIKTLELFFEIKREFLKRVGEIL
jgi:succinyl-diaminopimelate desuccinylase